MTRAMQGPCEEIEQTCLFRWAALESGAHPELALLHAIPNGGKRSKSEAARMKAAGVKPGVPDMFLPVAREGCHGLYIELKRRDGGRVSTEQTAWMEALARQGYKTALCHGWDAAREEIQRYLGGHAVEQDRESGEGGAAVHSLQYPGADGPGGEPDSAVDRHGRGHVSGG